MEEYEDENKPLLEKRVQHAPEDRFRVVYIIFYMLGIGSLLPWNFFSNAKQYFLFKLRNTTLSEKSFDDPDSYTFLQANFESYLTIAAMLPNVFFMFLNAALTKVIRHKIRIIGAAVSMIIMFVLTVILAKVNTNTWQIPFFAITIVTIVIMNAGSAVLQGGMFGVAGLFPPEYTQSVMGGMGMGGVLAAVAGILSIWLGSSPLDSGFGYFLVGGLVLVMAFMAYLCLPLMAYGNYYIDKRPRSVSVNSKDGDSEVIVNNPENSLFGTLRQIWLYGFSVFLLFFTTLSCYPAINSAIKSMGYDPKQGTAWSNKYFMPVTCFLFFNIGDLIGRTVAGLVQWPKIASKLMLVFAILRTLFIPLFLFCNVQPRGPDWPVLFHHDALPIVLMITFAFSNGYLGTLCMMYGPRLASEENMETAGAMMSFFLSLGLGSGASFSLLLLYFLSL